MKKQICSTTLCALVLPFILVPLAHGEEAPTSPEHGKGVSKPSGDGDGGTRRGPVGLLRYQPKKDSGRPVRVDGDGGSRGQAEKLPSIFVLAPKHEALTTNAEPTLFWYQTAPSACKFELTLTEPKKAQPLLNLTAGSKYEAGIHSVSLARHKITLTPNVSYHWSVALIPDGKNRSKDVIASGVVRYSEPPADLAARVANASLSERAVIYAQAGYWYDSLEAISLAIAADPKNAGFHKLRAALLEQGDLKEAATADRK